MKHLFLALMFFICLSCSPNYLLKVDGDYNFLSITDKIYKDKDGRPWAMKKTGPHSFKGVYIPKPLEKERKIKWHQ